MTDSGTAPDGDAAESPCPVADAAIELPADYYVTLRPLTLDLVATQLERVGITFSRGADDIQARWSTFAVMAWVRSGGLLNARVTMVQRYPARAHATLMERCNWWNATMNFLKASTTVVLAEAKPSDEAEGVSRTIPAVRVHLDLDLPLPDGVAPIQLQSLFRHIVGNVRHFEEQARLNDLILE